MRIGTEGSPTLAPSLAGGPREERTDEASTLNPQGVQTKLDGTRGTQKQAGGDSLELSPEAQQQVAKLRNRDQEVRAHEAAHMAAGGSLVRGGATYSYQQGPDGRRYAVGGEVSLDASPVRDNPQATLAKAEQLKRAALAPAQPSGQDRAVAAQASSMASEAAKELAKRSGVSSANQASAPPGSGLDLIG